MQREARREVFRLVNEQVASVSADWHVSDGQVRPLICECDTIVCATTLQVRPDLDARVRGDAAAYLVAPGHEDLDHEDLVERDASYLILCARQARRAAEQARESALVLRAQAEQQVRRAKRNRAR